MIRSLLLGNNEDAAYHPLAAVEQELFSILDGICDITSTVDRERLDELTTKQFDLLISYTDSWDQALDSHHTSAILGFVASGGGMLVIHNGISLQARPELSQLIGAKFNGHPAPSFKHGEYRCWIAESAKWAVGTRELNTPRWRTCR